MNHLSAAAAARQRSAEIANDEKVSLGFWIYIMTDCVLFASLFAGYAVLRLSTFGGPGTHELFDPPYVLIETLLLLFSSFTCGLGLLAAQAKDKSKFTQWFGITFILGCLFLLMELTEFRHLAIDGNSWRRSGFLSAYFTLVGTHGLHITSGLLWLGVLLRRFKTKGFDRMTMRRIGLFSIFWHFLDIVWIFIFTIVYMLGAA